MLPTVRWNQIKDSEHKQPLRLKSSDLGSLNSCAFSRRNYCKFTIVFQDLCINNSFIRQIASTAYR